MRSKVLIAAVAIMLGGIAAFTAFAYLNGIQRAAEAGSRMTDVLVAAQDIPRGTSASDLLASGAAVVKKMPLRYVPEGAMSSLTGVTDRVLAVPVTSGEVLTSARFQYPSEAGLAFNVPPGLVAVTVPVDDARGVAGLVKPGDRVAVLITVASRDGKGDQTGYAVPGTKVLAVGRSTGAEAEGPRSTSGGGGALSGDGDKTEVSNTITLAVSANDAEKVVFAAEAGRLWLALLPTTESAAASATVQSAATVLR